VDHAALTRCAALIGGARLAAEKVPDLAPADRPGSIADGYAAQAALHDYFRDRTGSALAGWKIGATTASMQTYLGVDGPAYGRVMTSNVYENGAETPASRFCNPGIECEIGMRIGADADGAPYTKDTIGALVGTVFPAIEIVENRFGDFLARGTPTLIADDFFHKACVLGDEIADWCSLDLAAAKGRTLIDGKQEGGGTGADVMGHPFEALAWLANTLAGHGLRLTAGQIVLTGSVARVIWVENATATAEIELDGLGPVSVDLT
jgi:2-keto-4-pentenoate hydratase